jgi:hypothetical protein
MNLCGTSNVLNATPAKDFSMKTILAALPAIAAIAIVATALPPQEYGSLTPALQATIAQELPPYTMQWQQARNDAMPSDMQQPVSVPAKGDTQDMAAPDPETVPH